MDPDRAKRLEALSEWTWNTIDDQWETGYRHLLAFVSEKRTSRVPQKYQTRNGFPLGTWVSHRRHLDQESKSADRKSRLEALPE